MTAYEWLQRLHTLRARISTETNTPVHYALECDRVAALHADRLVSIDHAIDALSKELAEAEEQPTLNRAA